MALRHVGIDPNSDEGQCPTVWVDEETGDFVFQGWKLDPTTMDEVKAAGAVPDYEKVVRLPRRMAAIIAKAVNQ
ncbi:MAG: hypothetical protein GEU94_06180 [Micromonosporaceae bacterium]|nr:hypothetical protein [Micromonosporaceae bacterium]